MANLSGIAVSHAAEPTAPSPPPTLAANLHVLPTLQGPVLGWALASASPTVLLNACMPFLPDHEETQHSDTAVSNSSAFGAVLRGDTKRCNAWSWANARRLGAALWLTAPGCATAAAERIAKATFAQTRTPSDVAIWYCAMGKLSLLAGLFRTSNEVRVGSFLARDFDSEGGRSAAAKNAHALLSQHKHAMAAAFFLLAHDVRAAVAVCLDDLADVQLAIMVCRLLDDSLAVPCASGADLSPSCARCSSRMVSEVAGSSPLTSGGPWRTCKAPYLRRTLNFDDHVWGRAQHSCARQA